jgi:26S proteasome regulatory subunit N5
MSDGKLEKMDKDFSPQVDVLLPETEALAKVNPIKTRVCMS